MAKRVQCARCGMTMYPNNVTQHKRGCDKMPLNDELREVAQTNTITGMSNLWNVSRTSIEGRLRLLGIRAKSHYGNPLSEKQIATIVRMYKDNNPLYEIVYEVHISSERLRKEIDLLFEAKVLTKRPIIARTRKVYPRCSACGARLDYDYDHFSVGGVCGLCLTDTDLPPDVFVMRSRFMAAAILNRAVKDSESRNGTRREAARWLAGQESRALFDLVDVISQDGALRLLSQ